MNQTSNGKSNNGSSNPGIRLQPLVIDYMGLDADFIILIYNQRQVPIIVSCGGITIPWVLYLGRLPSAKSTLIFEPLFFSPRRTGIVDF